ncbi:MAG: hypothetical protein WBM08_09285, partial [Prochlorococcaceae cyanobacterium]
ERRSEPLAILPLRSTIEKHKGTSVASTYKVQSRQPQQRIQRGSEDKRSELLRQASEFSLIAEAAADRGDLAESARHILLALDCERRAGSLGPQVLLLIKPRA